MIDAPGPWATGPFTLTEGYSLIDTEAVATDGDDCVWLQTEQRTPTVRLDANPNYWNKLRGPRVSRVDFRNDLGAAEALERVCDTTGEVDIVTGVPPGEAERVRHSQYAHLVAMDAIQSLAGVFNWYSAGVPLRDPRARRALNLALDRRGLVRDVFAGYARPLGGLTPPTPLTAAQLAPDRLRAYPHSPSRATRLWRAAGGAARPLRLAALEGYEHLAEAVAEQLRAALPVTVEVNVLRGERATETRRQLARKQPQHWDVLLLGQDCQTADAVPMELHRAFAGRSGEYRIAPTDLRFEELFADLRAQTAQAKQVLAANRIDRYVTRRAMALFLLAPQALYAVNNEVDFVPYATSFELAETSVSPAHWSRAAG